MYILYGFWTGDSVEFITPIFLQDNQYYRQILDYDFEEKETIQYYEVTEHTDLIIPLTQSQLQELNYDFSYYLHGYRIDSTVFLGDRFAMVDFLKENLVFLTLAKASDIEQLHTIDLFIKYMGD